MSKFSIELVLDLIFHVFTPRQNEGYCHHNYSNNCSFPRGCVVPTTTLVSLVCIHFAHLCGIRDTCIIIELTKFDVDISYPECEYFVCNGITATNSTFVSL